MPMIEIDEAELKNYQNLTGFLDRALKNPATRRKILEAQKTLDPNAVIPEIDAAAPLAAELDTVRSEAKALREEMAADRAKREEDARMATLTTKWNKGRELLENAGYTAEGIQRIEKLMEEEGIASHAVALSHYERLNPPPAPVNPASVGFTLLDNIQAGGSDDYVKALMESKGKDNGALDQQVRATLNEFRGNRR